VTHCAAGVRWFTFLCARRDASVGDTHVDAVNLWEGQAPLDTERAVENEKYAADEAASAARAKQERPFSEPNVADASAEKKTRRRAKRWRARFSRRSDVATRNRLWRKTRR
jgi:hypothetical protein